MGWAGGRGGDNISDKEGTACTRNLKQDKTGKFMNWKKAYMVGRQMLVWSIVVREEVGD